MLERAAHPSAVSKARLLLVSGVVSGALAGLDACSTHHAAPADPPALDASVADPPSADGTPSASRTPTRARADAAAPAAPLVVPGDVHVRARLVEKPHVGALAWSDARWHERCRGVRTSYNADRDLDERRLTLGESDPRWLDFVFWTMGNKVNEHQTEAYGGSGWSGPNGGVIFHWAPGSHWENDSLASFGFFIGHVVGEHRWTDTMFPDFFEKYGGTYGVNLKDRLAEIDPSSNAPWVEFLEYSGGLDSPYYRYLLHVDSAVDVPNRRIVLTAGQGIAFWYSFERYRHELAVVLTDCRAVDFFEMYDRFGPGFAARGDWANQRMYPTALDAVGYTQANRWPPVGGAGGATSSSPEPPEAAPAAIPADLPDAARMVRGAQIYAAECVDCHGAAGDGAGYLGETFDVKPRDFRQGKYEFRSTAWGELPTIADVERSVRVGVPGTTMPAWGQFLDDEQIGDVARFLVVYSDRFTKAWRNRAVPSSLAVPRTPPEVLDAALHPTGDPHPCGHGNDSPAAACRGEELWNSLQCGWCHGDDFRGDGPTSRGMLDDWGHPIRPANLGYKWLFRNGHEPEDVYRTIFGGLNGTPMASYAPRVASVEDRWALVAFVLSLSPRERPVLHAREFAATRAYRIGPDGLVRGSPR